MTQGIKGNGGGAMISDDQAALLKTIEGEARADGTFAVTSWPKPKWSNPNILDEEWAAFAWDSLNRN